MKRFIAVIAMVALMASGCAVDSGDHAGVESSPRPGEPGFSYQESVAGLMSDEQAEAMVDGVVDLDEYQEGYRRFADCLAAAGYEVEVGVDAPAGEMVDGQFIDYSVPDAAVTSGAFLECYEREYFQVDITWQTSR